jgi:hypothetical protein
MLVTDDAVSDEQRLAFEAKGLKMCIASADASSAPAMQASEYTEGDS